jgi:hypothetical protein
MRHNKTLPAIIFVMILFSCRKQQEPNTSPPPVVPPTVPVMHVLLKDVLIPHLPSPFYHFEYNADSLVTKADFSSGFTVYDIIYRGNKIAEMQNNIFINHDTLRYFYEDDRKLSVIRFINQVNVVYRNVFFNYQGNHLKEIWWNRKDENGDFPVDRMMTFFYAGDNVTSIREQRRAASNEGLPWHIFVRTFEQYDQGLNVDDFMLLHDGIHDHLFLSPDFRLQKNNPGKETFLVDGIELYTVNYTYIYNSDYTPSIKKGDFRYTGGPDANKSFETKAFYSYY